MALVPELTPIDGERVTLNSARYAFTIISNLFVFGVFSLLQVFDLTEREQFQYLTFSVLGVGSAASALFILGTHEPSPEEVERMCRFSSNIAATNSHLALLDNEEMQASYPITSQQRSCGMQPLTTTVYGAETLPSDEEGGGRGRKHSLDSILEEISTTKILGQTSAKPTPASAGQSEWTASGSGDNLAISLPRSSYSAINGGDKARPSPVPEGGASSATRGAEKPGFLLQDSPMEYSASDSSLNAPLLRDDAPTPDPSLDQDPETVVVRRKGRNRRMTWRCWFRETQFYIVGLNYMFTRLIVNVSQVYVPFFVLKTLEMDTLAIGIVPLLVYISSFLATTVVKKVDAKIGRNMTFNVGAAICGAASLGFLFLNQKVGFLVYPLACFLGAGNATIMVTSVSMEAGLVGKNVESGAFVYGALSLTDKFGNGIVILVIQILQTHFDDMGTHAAAEFIRYITGAVPLAAAIAGVITTLYVKL